ncbi:MAG TPA: hypothetical protein VLF17_07465 [Candidatus Nitrosotenuis sp.]|nr:hypothetical protein [Candidatus Nitrosotenuis sp.]
MIPNTNMFLGITVAIAAIGFLGIITTNMVYAQSTTTATQDLTSLLTTIIGIITTIAALAGGIIASFARMSKNLGLAKDDQIDKMMHVAKELESSDHWGKEIEERLVAIVDVVAALPGGKDMLEQKRIDMNKWKEEASQISSELDLIYKEMIPRLAKR